MKNIDKLLLPSCGVDGNTPKEVTVRDMKGSQLSTLYSSLTDASIEAIIGEVTKEDINVELLCDEDKAAILHKTRRLTFGDEVQQTLRCPHCNKIHDYTIDYNDLETVMLDTELFNEPIVLSDGTIITRRLPNKAIIAEILRQQEKFQLDKSTSYNLMLFSKIDTINGKTFTVRQAVDFLEALDGRDWALLSKMLDIRFGLNPTYIVECKDCGLAIPGGLGINADLFR